MRKSRGCVGRGACGRAAAAAHSRRAVAAAARCASPQPPIASPAHNETKKTVHGNPRGAPALFLHGGPGAGCWPNHARFFDPQQYRVVLLDQRGCGRSSPRGALVNAAGTAGVDDGDSADGGGGNGGAAAAALVGDLEALRSALGVRQWAAVLGGSWGAALALAYAQRHPRSIAALVLRGCCFMRPAEVAWVYAPSGGAAALRPLQFAEFAAAAAPGSAAERAVPLLAYYRRLLSGDAGDREEAVRSFAEPPIPLLLPPLVFLPVLCCVAGARHCARVCFLARTHPRPLALPAAAAPRPVML